MSNTQLTRIRRLDSLTGLRIFAALLVFAHHATAYQSVGGIPSLLTQSGVDGVSFFFILSGFVLAWSARPGTSPAGSSDAGSRASSRCTSSRGRAALRSRSHGTPPVVWRTDPVRVPDPVVGAGPEHPFRREQRRLVAVRRSILLHHLPAADPADQAHPHQATFVWVIAGCVAVVIGAAFVFHPTAPSGFGYWAIYVCPLIRLPEFLAGATAALLMRLGYRVRFPLPAAVALAVAVVVAANWLPLYLLFSAATIIPFLLVIVSAAQRDIDGRGSFASWAPIVKLGEWSYAFYLFHLLVLRVLINVNSHIGAPWWAVAWAGPRSGRVSGVVCEFVEKPLDVGCAETTDSRQSPRRSRS